MVANIALDTRHDEKSSLYTALINKAHFVQRLSKTPRRVVPHTWTDDKVGERISNEKDPCRSKPDAFSNKHLGSVTHTSSNDFRKYYSS